MDLATGIVAHTQENIVVKTTKEQRQSLKRIYNRTLAFTVPMTHTYREFRKTVEPAWGCIMVPFAGMWLGVEPDGYTHS